MSKVFITDYITSAKIEKRILGNNLTNKIRNNISILLVYQVDKDYLDKFPKLKAVIRYGVGYDNIDLKELKRRKIVFCNTPDYGLTK